jgi:cytochrome P450
MTNPYIYNKLRAEIDGAIIAGKISSPVVRDAEARALPYLQAVIMESLRICPPAGGLLSKVTPPEGDTVCGVFVPGGVEFTGITWAALRNENIFGQQPDLFRPERWLDVPEEKFKEMARVTDLAFGHGMYKCLGRTVALMELNKISVEVSFDINFLHCFSQVSWLLLFVFYFLSSVRYERSMLLSLMWPRHGTALPPFRMGSRRSGAPVDAI